MIQKLRDFECQTHAVHMPFLHSLSKYSLFKWPEFDSSFPVGRRSVTFFNFKIGVDPNLWNVVYYHFTLLFTTRWSANAWRKWSWIPTNSLLRKVSRFAGIAQSVQQLAKVWTVRESNSGGGENFCTRPNRPWSPTEPPIQRAPGYFRHNEAGAWR